MQTICRECVNIHKRQYMTENHERALEWTRARRARNPEDHRTRNRNRKALQRSVAGKHTAEQIREQYKRQKGKCYYCGKRITWGDHHVEHTFPLKRIAGTDIPGNDISYLVIACEFCNIQKHDKFPWEYPQGGRLL